MNHRRPGELEQEQTAYARFDTRWAVSVLLNPISNTLLDPPKLKHSWLPLKIRVEFAARTGDAPGSLYISTERTKRLEFVRTRAG